jgi:hypothetical protein
MISPSQRPLPTQDNTTYEHETNIHALSGIQNLDPSNQAAADLRLRLRGHWDRQQLSEIYQNMVATTDVMSLTDPS